MPNKEIDIDGDSSGRKRISLACQRCRKRKIKCEPSGDAGDGLACIACQSAKSTNCQYLRVNSGEVLCPSPDSSNGPWHFSIPTNEDTSYSVVPMANDLSQYSINNPSQMATVTTRTPYRITPSHADTFNRTSSLSYATSPQRQYQSMAHHNSIGSDFYGGYPPQNGFSFNGNNALSSSAYALQDTSPAWTSSPDCGSAPTETTLSQNQSMDYGTLQYPDSAFSGADASSNRADVSSYFPGLSPLASHLPVSIDNGRARCLPNPAGLQNQFPGGRIPSQASESSFSTANSQYTPETDSDTWTSATMLSDQNSSSVASSGGTENDSPLTTRQAGLVYEYATPLDPNPMSACNMIAYPALSLPTMRDHTDHQPRATEPSLDAYLPGYARLPTLNNSFEEYHYAPTGTDPNATTVSMSSESATPRGHRLLQPQPRRSSYGRPSLSGHTEAVAKDERKSASSRRQERKFAGRHK